MPEVTSTVVRLDFSAATPVSLPSAFGPLVRGIFTMRRKMLANALGPVAASLNRQPAAVLDTAGVDGRRRPETLAVDELVRLAEALDKPN
jgi:16S rRNA (adenine1518-N6/adenine1519-N6)-dimethyltransferase